MGIVTTGITGIPLRDIIKKLGNHDYDLIMFRCKWVDLNGNNQDELYGYCKYKNNKLIPLDADSYSLDDLYSEWEEWVDVEEEYFDNGKVCLTVWEEGIEELI